MELYFESLRFMRVSEWFGEHYACLLEHNREGTMLRLYNLNPSAGLAEGMARGTACLCFSATMTPQPYFQRLMGVAENSNWYRIAAPFDPGHLGVFSAPFISTAYRDRDATLDELVQLVADVVAQCRGNYIVFLPSHVYLARVHERFCEMFPDVDCIRQVPGMSEMDREIFLGQFSDERAATLVGFAIMGGVFGEAVDLKGSRLIGAIVVGVGLPGIGIERDLIRDYFDACDEHGFEFAYQYPGINRVMQTAGRVIRSESDRGIVCLVDRRFAEARYRTLLPKEWRIRQLTSRETLAREVGAFWRGVSDAGWQHRRSPDPPG